MVICPVRDGTKEGSTVTSGTTGLLEYAKSEIRGRKLIGCEPGETIGEPVGSPVNGVDKTAVGFKGLSDHAGRFVRRHPDKELIHNFTGRQRVKHRENHVPEPGKRPVRSPCRLLTLVDEGKQVVAVSYDSGKHITNPQSDVQGPGLGARRVKDPVWWVAVAVRNQRAIESHHTDGETSAASKHHRSADKGPVNIPGPSAVEERRWTKQPPEVLINGRWLDNNSGKEQPMIQSDLAPVEA
jgi:hypothetical protein